MNNDKKVALIPNKPYIMNRTRKKKKVKIKLKFKK